MQIDKGFQSERWIYESPSPPDMVINIESNLPLSRSCGRGARGEGIIKMMERFRKHKSPPEVKQKAKELRRSQTPAENTLWEILRNRKLGSYKFRRQHPIGPFIVDFYCDEVRLVIELDGDIHNRQKEYNQARDLWLEENAYQILRFRNESIEENEENIEAEILIACERGRKKLPF